MKHVEDRIDSISHRSEDIQCLQWFSYTPDLFVKTEADCIDLINSRFCSNLSKT